MSFLAAAALLLVQTDDSKILDEMKSHIGDDARVEKVDDIFFVGTDGPQSGLDRCKGTIRSVVKGLYKDFLKTKTTKPLKVYLFSNKKSYGDYCENVLKEAPSTPFGFYLDSRRELIMNIATGTGTLAHELVHPLLAADFEGVPAWFNEGFASLLEQSTTKADGTLQGLVNWRLPNLQKQIKADTAPSLESVMKTTTSEFYDDKKSGIHYAAARYLVMYLQEKGKLADFYREFHDHFEKDKSGITALEKVGGKKLDALEKDWRDWVQGLKYE